jgi:uncharacterized membrane protein YdjX (TVP38/TMEM64 family)
MRKLAVLGVLLLGSAAWFVLPVAGRLRPEDLAAGLEPWRDSVWAAPAVLGLYVLAGLVMAPSTVLMLATALVFDPLRGFLYTMAGMLASAAAVFALGRRLGEEAAERLTRGRLAAVRDRLRRHGIVAVAVVRNLPVAPFPVVSLASGALGLRARDFLLGTALGLAPGVAGLQLLAERLGAALRQPDAFTLTALAAVALALVGLGALVQRRLDRAPK